MHEIHRAVHWNGVRQRGAETRHFVETQKSDHTANDHRMRHHVVREPVHEVGFDFSEFDAKVRLVDAQRHRGGGAQTVSTHDHRDGDDVKLEMLQVRQPEMGQSQRFPKHHVALEHPKVDSLAHVIGGDVHAIVRVRRDGEEKIRVNVLARGVNRSNACDVIDASVFGYEKCTISDGEDHERHKSPETSRLDGVQKQLARDGVVHHGQV